MRILHLLITRFNLRLEGVDRDREGRDVLTERWLEERLRLFERYCLPSVAHQTLGDFRWFVLLDEASGEALRKRFDAWADAVPALEPVWLPPVADDEDLAAAVLERAGEDADTLVTTRLDNDDALHEDALAVVRERVRPERREFVNLRLGWVTDETRAKVVSHKYGPFTTFVEPRDAAPWRTVHCGLPHGRVGRLAPVRQIRDRPYWLRVIHERNVANAAFEERREFDFTRPRQVHSWFRHRVARRVRRWFWPARFRGVRPLEEVAGAFHVGEALPALAGRPAGGGVG